VRLGFPDLPRWHPDRAALAGYRFSRNTARYRPALRLAALILFQLAPDLTGGHTPLLALLFDMNLLWERYVAALMRRVRLPGMAVRTQDSAPFWRGDSGDSFLRPDITLRDGTEVVLIVDTKWKLPKRGAVTGSDLKQMFCYHELFACSQSVLLYPATEGASSLRRRGRYAHRDHRCAVGFLCIDHDPSAELSAMLTALRNRDHFASRRAVRHLRHVDPG
jgi:5-methylcytosine-specific restriction enzyme subunit McrC